MQGGGDQLRRSQMDRVERPESERFENPCGVEERIVETDQVEVLEKTPGGRSSGRARGTNGAKDLGSSESARHSPRLTSEVAPERSRLGFLHDQLHQGGGIQINHLGFSALVGAKPREAPSGPFRARGQAQGWRKVEEITLPPRYATGSFQCIQHVIGRCGGENGDGPTSVRHLEAFAATDSPHGRGRVLL